jgi:uncharacterized RDD family membrane protein YckC
MIIRQLLESDYNKIFSMLGKNALIELSLRAWPVSRMGSGPRRAPGPILMGVRIGRVEALGITSFSLRSISQDHEVRFRARSL